ncbi:MAG: hypothetical protein WA948_13455, partial [Pontixanthobacter sp.]
TAPPVGTTGAISAGSTSSDAASTSEAKTRFNAALDEAKAGATALKGEASDRAASYREQARDKSKDMSADAKVKANELAIDAKTKASGGISSLSKTVLDNAGMIDEKLGQKYGDYARTASRKLDETATTLDQKSVDELSEDARAAVRKSPGMAVGAAAMVGFMIARLFSGGRR